MSLYRHLPDLPRIAVVTGRANVAISNDLEPRKGKGSRREHHLDRSSTRGQLQFSRFESEALSPHKPTRNPIIVRFESEPALGIRPVHCQNPGAQQELDPCRDDRRA